MDTKAKERLKKAEDLLSEVCEILFAERDAMPESAPEYDEFSDAVDDAYAAMSTLADIRRKRSV